MRKGGFTLVELLIVIIVIAVLAAVSVPKFANRGQVAKESVVRADLKNLRQAIERFHADTGLWPAELAHLDDLTAPASGLNNGGNRKPIVNGTFHGPYLERTPTSPITAGSYTYDIEAPGVGNVNHPAGRASDGTNLWTW